MCKNGEECRAGSSSSCREVVAEDIKSLKLSTHRQGLGPHS